MKFSFCRFWLHGSTITPIMKKLSFGTLVGRPYSLQKSHKIPQFKVFIRFFSSLKNGILNLLFFVNAIEQFTRALDLMNRSLAVGGQVDFTPPPVPIMTPIIAAPHPVPETIVPHGFRELVEYRCAQQGILCIPLVNRFQAGRPIFRVGNVLCYFDRQVREI